MDSQNKENLVEDDCEGWIVVTRKKGRQPKSIQTKSHFHQKYGKGSNFHKKEKRNKKMWKPKPIKGKDEDFFQPRRSITLT